jgi:hypothetical protein
MTPIILHILHVIDLKPNREMLQRVERSPVACRKMERIFKRSPHIHCITQLRWLHTRMNVGVIKLWYTPLKSCRAITSCKSLTQAIITVLRPLNRKEHRRQLSKMERDACYFVSPVVKNQLWKRKEGNWSTTETVNIIIKVQRTKTQFPYQPTKDTKACNSIKKMTGMVQLIMFIVAPNWEE